MIGWVHNPSQTGEIIFYRYVDGFAIYFLRPLVKRAGITNLPEEIAGIAVAQGAVDCSVVLFEQVSYGLRFAPKTLYFGQLREQASKFFLIEA